MTPVLQARLAVRRGSFLLDAELHVEQGEVLALLGPNGAGKSTLLATLAGLIRPEAGTVTISGGVLTRRSVKGGPDVWVPPERREIGLLGQQALLFPHLSAIDNVAFGRESQGMRRRDARKDAGAWLEAVGLAGLEQHKPAALSGGQQQRVAIARALAARPKVLLLDEPMASLDVQTASATRELLRERLADSGVATVLVTHDVLDAIVLASRVAVMQEGRIIDDGPKERVLGMPRNQFTAALAGVNLLIGSADGNGGMLQKDGRHFVGKADSRSQPRAGEAVSAVFRPAAVGVRPVLPAGSGAADDSGVVPINEWKGAVAALEPSSGGIRIRVAGDAPLVAELSPLDIAELGLRVGQQVWLTVDPADLSIHPLAR